MPFDNPYFPQVFDVGDQGGAHIHFDNTGEYFYNANGQLAYQLLPAGATFFGPGGNVSIIPAPAAGRPAIHFAFPGAASDAILQGGASGSQGQLNASSPLSANGAFLNLTGDDPNNGATQPVAAITTTGGTSVSAIGRSPSGLVGGLFRARVQDAAGAQHDVTYDGTSFDIPGTLLLAGAVASPLGLAHLEIKNSPGDLATNNIAVQTLAGQGGDIFRAIAPNSSDIVRILASGEYRSISGILIGDSAVIQTRIWGVGAAPAAGLGSGGDFAFRWNGGVGARLYYNNAGTWQGIL